MTSILQKLKNKLAEHNQQNPRMTNEVRYVYHTRDGKYDVINHACWASIRDWGGNQSHKPLTKLLIDMRWGRNHTYSPEETEEYYRGVERFLYAYEHLLIKDSFENRRAHGFCVTLINGKADLVQLGAFLIGWRNLGEFGNFRLLNRLIDEGVKLERAIIISQMFKLDGKTVGYNYAGHNVFNNVSHYWQLDDLTAFIKSDYLTKVSPQHTHKYPLALKWTFQHIQPYARASVLEGQMAEHIKRVQETRFGETFTIGFETESFIKFVLENWNE